MERRTDKKGRILLNGESQRKDGRYVYKYLENGKEKFVYSWKLVSSDRIPKGKRDCIALRDKIKDIHKDLADGIDTIGKKMTLRDLYLKQNANRPNVRKSTVESRKCLLHALEQDPLGNRSIDTIKPSDAIEWAVRMKEKGYAYNTIHNFKRSLIKAFYIAIDDDYVRKNPFTFKLSDVIADDTEEKKPLNDTQVQTLLEFIKNDKTYHKHYQAIIILLNTGLRIGELCGLTTADIDIDNRIININHQLKMGTDGYYIEEPKSESGKRKIPMTEIVCQAIKEVMENRGHAQPIVIDGYRDFLFLKKDGYPMYGSRYSNSFRAFINKYNKNHSDEELPKITPHTLRHTFCTNMANKGMTPNNLQYIMGHQNITMTLGYYAHGGYQSALKEMQRLSA